MQQNVNMQIVIADDGSKYNYKDEIAKFFLSYPSVKYEFSNNNTNVGTVNNIYNAILKAKGEYTYVISPGDYFFSENTLAGIYGFSVKNQIEIAFGKSQYYRRNCNNIELIKQMNPSSPEIYNKRWLSKQMKTLAYCTTQGIVGACFFRKTETFREYLEIIKDMSKYDEDNTSTYIHLLLYDKSVYFYNEYVVWYEFGSGISTSANNSFLKILEDDCNRVLSYINAKKKQQLIPFVLLKEKRDRIINYPLLSARYYIVRKIGNRMTYTDYLTSTTTFFDEITK